MDEADEPDIEGGGSRPPVSVRVGTTAVVGWLVAITALLAVANAVSIWLQVAEKPAYGFTNLFNVDIELSAPTWFSTALLATAALLMWVIQLAPSEQRDRRNWRFLSIVLVVMSIDEIGAYHEYWTGPLRRSIDGSGLLYASWVVPAAALVVAVAVSQLAFLRRLHRPTALRLLASGAVFLVGALGVESLGASYAEDHGGGAGYLAHAAVEEALEMLGSIGVIRALLLHLRQSHDHVSITLD